MASLETGCSPSEDTDRSPPVAVGPADVTITATDYAFDQPDTLVAGWSTFRLVNHGEQPHMAQLVRLDPGTTVEEFLSAYEEAFRTAGPRPESARRLGGPTVAVPQDTTNATLHLEPGQYVWICLFDIPDGIPHVVGHGMAMPFIVEAETGDRTQQAPVADLDVRLVDYSFGFSAPLQVGRQRIRVVNSGSEPHEIGIVKLLPGKTIEDVRAWARNPGEEPPLDLRDLGGVTSLASGEEAYFDMELTPGEYALLCFVTAPDGRPHIEHGMIQQIRVG